MPSPLDIVDGAVQHAVLTTFTVDLAFIDRWVLPKLSNAGVRNIIIFCDSRQLGEQLAVGGSRRAGQHYQLVPIDSVGAFHPKVVYLAGSEQQRVCVSSANLTPAGQLRNLETAGMLISEHPEHLTALHDVREFLREIGAEAPGHATEALLSALEHAPTSEEAGDSDRSPSVRFIHNLTTPIIEQLPPEASGATAPFATADALERLASLANPTIYLDHRQHSAIAAASGLDLQVATVEYVDEDSHPVGRVAHGKALWHESGWCLVGSPNLTRPALLRPASAGNVEAALLFASAPEFALPQFRRVEPQVSPASLSGDRPSSAGTARAFTATLDGVLEVELPDGTLVDYATDTYWKRLGTVADRVVKVEELPPVTRLRATLPNGQLAYAIVHYPTYLRARRRAPQSRAASVVDELPLDLQGQRELEAILGDLYALDELSTGAGASNPGAVNQSGAKDPDEESIDSWRPARPGDDPRVPDLYRNTYAGDPDALLALVRNALRLQAEATIETAAEDNEEWDEDKADREVAAPSQRTPLTTAAVIRRYRKEILASLARGAERVKSARQPSLRDLTFLTVLRYHERLVTTMVRVPADQVGEFAEDTPPDHEGFVEIPLLKPELLTTARLDLLEAYVHTGASLVGDCSSALFGHLAAAVDQRDLLDELQQNRLDDLCYEVAPSLLSHADPERAELEWLSPQRRVALLEPFAERVDWYAIADHAANEGWITAHDLFEEPHPLLVGRATFSSRLDSPAWHLVGYACIAGYEDPDPFGAVVCNDNDDSGFEVHCLQVEPTGRAVRGDRIHEALKRRSDGKWLSRTYRGFNRRSADHLLEIVGIHRVLKELDRAEESVQQEPPAWVLSLPMIVGVGISEHQYLGSTQ